MKDFQEVFSATTPLKVMKGRKDIGITKVADKEFIVYVLYNLVRDPHKPKEMVNEYELR